MSDFYDLLAGAFVIVGIPALFIAGIFVLGARI